MNKWIRRKRNSHGYGVQSPSDFFFVQHVLREEMPYYGYSELQQAEGEFSTSLPRYSMSINRLLFRLANHVHPRQVIEVGTGAGLATYAMAKAVPSGYCVTIDSSHQHTEEVVSALARFAQVSVLNGDEMALPHVGDGSLFIIEGIDADADKRAWWETLQESLHAVVSYDVDSVGLLRFDKARYKNRYWISLKK